MWAVLLLQIRRIESVIFVILLVVQVFVYYVNKIAMADTFGRDRGEQLLLR
jgi:hypothetical protein